jgi:hypothetical protein
VPVSRYRVMKGDARSEPVWIACYEDCIARYPRQVLAVDDCGLTTGDLICTSALDPDRLSRSLTLRLDGGLASGSVDGLPDAPAAAKEAARALVTLAISH